MKKILAMVLALTMIVGAVFTMSSCAKDENTLVCGVTVIPGLNEKDKDGNWTGFETEFAQEVGKILGMNVEFKEIKWANKYIELNSGKIDCIWNGFTAGATEDDGNKRSDLVDFSYGYMTNRQCVVVKKDRLADYTSQESLAGKTIAVETGSAGESFAKTVNAKEVVGVNAQIDAFLQLNTNKVDCLVVDVVLALNMCGKADYSNLAIVNAIELESETYAIGFKKDSNLTEKVNAAIKQLEENGKLMEIATKYNFSDIVKVSELAD